MNVWEQIRLFLGDLSLALFERETGWVATNQERGGERERGDGGGNKHKTRKIVEEKGSCCFLEGRKGLSRDGFEHTVSESGWSGGISV